MMRRTLLRRIGAAGHPLVRGRLTRHTGNPLTWDIQASGQLAIVVVNGELDASTVPGLSERLAPLAGAGSHIILYLAGVRFCDCAGLSLFLRLQQRACAAGGSLHLAAPTASVRRLVTLARLSDVLPIADSPADVIAGLDSEPNTGPPLPRPDDGDS